MARPSATSRTQPITSHRSSGATNGLAALEAATDALAASGGGELARLAATTGGEAGRIVQAAGPSYFGNVPVTSCTIVVTDANALTRAIHDRMPVVLDKADVGRWLSGAAGTEVLRPAGGDSLRIAGRRPRACFGRRRHAAHSAACRRRESTVPATAPLRARPASGERRHLDTWGNAGCRRSCRRSRYGRRPRSRSVRHGRRAPPCDSARSHSSPSIARGSHGSGWPLATQGRDRGGCPRPPEQVEPWPAALRRRRLLTVSLHTLAARRAEAFQGALDLGNHSDRHATVAGCRLRLGMSEQRLNHANVLAALEQMSRKAVAKRMHRHRLAQPRGFASLLEQPAELTRGHWPMLTAAWKQPVVFRR